MKTYTTECDSKRWHCRPRRHGEDPTRVVVAVYSGHDAASRQSDRRLHRHRLGRRRNRAKNLHSNPASPLPNGRLPAPADKIKINFLDTPGYSTFINETKASLIAADAALILVDAAAGVQVVTEKVWDYATEYDMPRAFVLNWMDRELASFERAMRFAATCFRTRRGAVQLPIGQEKSFKGVIDLITMQALIYTPDGDGKAKIERNSGRHGRRSQSRP